MAARTYQLKFYASKSVEEGNMGSFLSSSKPEPNERQRRLQSHEQAREGSRSLSQNKTICHIEGNQEKIITKTKADESSQQHQKTPGKNCTSKGKKAPGLAQGSTTSSGKLPAGTPRPQRPPGRSASTCSLLVGRQMNSASKRRVIIADQSADPATGVAKDTEEQGPYRRGTPHPKRKRVSICSKILDAGGDTNNINCNAGEIRMRLANKTKEVNFFEPESVEVHNKCNAPPIQSTSNPIQSASNGDESSGKSNVRKLLCDCSDEERNIASKSRKSPSEYSGSDDEPLSNLKTDKRYLQKTSGDEELIESKTSKRTLVFSPDTPRPPTRCSKNRPTTSSIDLQCGGDATVNSAIVIAKKSEVLGKSISKPHFPNVPVLSRNGDNNLSVPACSMHGEGGNIDTQAGSSCESNNKISLVTGVTEPVSAKPDEGDGQKPQEEKRKRKVCPSPGRGTPKRLCRVQRVVEGAPASPGRKRTDCSTQTSTHRPGAPSSNTNNNDGEFKAKI